ncbi:ATP-binding protein [Streptomyces jumonjinensis]|uniref:ATP-binding protein n=1 Tax=Streptomyces jumonjinensis TaxID=1945 RepID=UPI001E2F74A3|nr:ATP-binding protein [Streptomyces jumonjinensis]
MKQSAAKTLGAAALGTAFVAAGAGTAAAEPAAFPDSATSLDTISSVVPAERLLTQVPAVSDALAGAQGALTQGAATLPGTLQGAGQRALSPEAPKDLLGSLLGGLPLNQLTQALGPLGGAAGPLTGAAGPAAGPLGGVAGPLGGGAV